MLRFMLTLFLTAGLALAAPFGALADDKEKGPKGRDNDDSNAQWREDATRGQERADERRHEHHGDHDDKEPKQKKGKKDKD